MSREVFFTENTRGQKRADIAADNARDNMLVNDTSSDVFINDVSDNTSTDNKTVGPTLLNNASDDAFQNEKMTSASSIQNTSPAATLEDPVVSDCVAASVRAYFDKNYFDSEYNYFMVTRCFKDNSNDTINEKCQHPRYDRLDETGPVTSLRTKHNYWNIHCALCNKDAEDVVVWNATVSLSTEYYYFANTSRHIHFPKTVDELHPYLADSYGGITYTPAAAAKERVCLPKKEHLSCSRLEDANTNNHKDPMANDCSQFYNPVTLNILGSKRSYMNAFCMFCVNSEIQPARNAGCAEGNLQKGTGGMVKGLLDYRKEQYLESSADDHGFKEGTCRCTEVEDPYLSICRPAFCAPGDIWMKCRCAQPIKILSGIKVRVILKLMPGPRRIDVTIATQIRKMKMAVTRFLQNTVENTKAEILAIFHLASDSKEYLLCVATLRSNPGHDTKETMEPLMKYLDKENTHGIKVGKTRYAIQFTSRVLVWVEDETKLAVKDLDTDGVYNMTAYQFVDFGGRELQPLSPLLYCKQIQLNATEYSETDGLVNINTTSPTLTLPYYYRIDTKQIRVCLEHYLKRSFKQRKTNGTDKNHSILSVTLLMMFLMVSLYDIV